MNGNHNGLSDSHMSTSYQMPKTSTPRAPRAKAPKGTQAGRVYVPLTADERRALEAMAAEEERGASAMARQIYLAGLKSLTSSAPASA